MKAAVLFISTLFVATGIVLPNFNHIITMLLLNILVNSALFNFNNCLYKTNYTLTEDQVTFYLFNRQSGDDELQITRKNLYLLNNSLPFVFLIHGYNRSHTQDWIEESTEEYLINGDYNVVQVDWSVPAAQTYDISSNLTKPVGR